MTRQPNGVILDMLERIPSGNEKEKKDALRHVIQEVILYGFSKTDFFDRAAFCGGTAIRLFHRLPRFSEDLDFSLISPDKSFRLSDYFEMIDSVLRSYDFSFTIEEKQKIFDSGVRTAYVTGNAKELVLWFFPDGGNVYMASNEKIRIKLKVSVNPPPGATCELLRSPLPAMHYTRVYDLPSLFAGKIAAILMRSSHGGGPDGQKRFQNRDKGRDLYDYLYLLSRDTHVNMDFLNSSLTSRGYIGEDFALTRDSLMELLEKRFKEIRYDTAKDDVRGFLRSADEIEDWDSDFFVSVTRDFLK
ncbi:MAG: nucleotidyl transferase AbiEii/AbiGii toxin family protein [Clostridia bacterium]|nr:nucleotidyl transferase AbiEii/AbiGii toxin family protein [Clostridia bacterium]